MSFWDTIVEKVNKELANWKKNYISLGGRITLIKAALANIPIYYMSIFKLPSKVIKILEKSQRDFLWEGGTVKKDHLVSWEVACRPKAQGGLGVGRLKDRNKALLAKWIWRFCTEKGTLQHSIILSKLVVTQTAGTSIPLQIVSLP